MCAWLAWLGWFFRNADWVNWADYDDDDGERGVERNERTLNCVTLLCLYNIDIHMWYVRFICVEYNIDICNISMSMDKWGWYWRSTLVSSALLLSFCCRFGMLLEKKERGEQKDKRRGLPFHNILSIKKHAYINWYDISKLKCRIFS